MSIQKDIFQISIDRYEFGLIDIYMENRQISRWIDNLKDRHRDKHKYIYSNIIIDVYCQYIDRYKYKMISQRDQLTPFHKNKSSKRAKTYLGGEYR